MSDDPSTKPDFVFDPVGKARMAERLKREQAERDAVEARRRARDDAALRAITRNQT